MSTINEIMDLLKRFEKAYTDRDIDNVDILLNNLFVKEGVQVIGTSAVSKDCEEWCNTIDLVKTLFINDFKYWGDVSLDLANADISLTDHLAFVSIVGSVQEEMKNTNYYDFRLQLIDDTLKNDDMGAKDKLIEIMRGASDTLYETNKGETYVWPLRVSLVATKEEEGWKIRQCHFSYPITFYPQVRTV